MCDNENCQCNIQDICDNSSFREVVNGRDGLDGKDGRDGRNGSRGHRGHNGQRGERGEKGERGSNGDKGDKGERGEKGESCIEIICRTKDVNHTRRSDRRKYNECSS